MEIENLSFQQIEYPLNSLDDLIKREKLFCDNPKIPDFSNIEIIFNKNDKNPTLYRCPSCLCIPFLYYEELYIVYKCNCGTHICSLDYFFSNFISYPIDKIIFKENKEKNNKIAFCSSCVKFINNVDKHKKEYYGHIIRNTNYIKGNNYTEFKLERNHYYEGINQVFKCEKLKEKERKINFINFIQKYLNFNIIEKIETSYKNFLKEFNKRKENIKKNVKQKKIEFSEEFNEKLYSFSKFMYYVFQINYSRKNLNLQIIYNIFYVVYHLYEFCIQDKNKKEQKNEFDIFKNYFLEDFYITKKDIVHKNDELYYLTGSFYLHYIEKIKTLYFDKTFKKFIISDLNQIYITYGKELYNICYQSKYINGFNIIYFDKIKTNVLSIKNRYETINKIKFCDIKDCKIMSEIILPNALQDWSYKGRTLEYKMKSIELLNNIYLIVNIERFQSFWDGDRTMGQTILLYLLVYENNSFKFDYLNTFYDYIDIFESDKIYEQMYKIYDMICLKDKKYFIFYKMNIQKKNLEESFKINIEENLFGVEINEIKDNKILIKYFHKKFEIYDIKLKQKISIFKPNDTINNVFLLDDKYFIRIKNNKAILYKLKTFKQLNILNDLNDYKNCIIFKDDYEKWNFISGRICTKIENEKFGESKYIYKEDESYVYHYSSYILSSSEEYE